ncbi:MAG: GAF domain-containing protein [Dehalococcoidia bacterium]|nr:GAF domain-containing protein [Dehalococcoidia bacterium]
MGGRRTKPQLASGDKALDLSLQDLVNSLEDELFIVDNEYHIKFVNSAIMQRLGGHAASPVGRLCYEVFEARGSPCSSHLWLCPINKVLDSGKSIVIVHPRYPISSDIVSNEHIRIVMYPLRDSRGNISAVAELRRDVTVEKEMEHQVLRRHHYLQALSRISSATSGLRNLNSILNVCLDIALESVDGEIGGILLFDEQKQRLHYRVSRGLSAKYVEKMQMAPGEGIAGRVVKTGEPILVEDISKDARVVHKDLISTEGLKGFASVPLKAKEKVVGVINMASHMPGRFREDDIYLLNSMGCQIGIAIEQARLYDRLASAARRYQTLLRHALTAQEDERKRIARELHDETSQAITSLTLSLQAIMGMAEMKGIVDKDIIERLRSTHAYTVHAGNEIVKLMKELRPTLLDELGMPAAIHRYAKDTLQTQGVGVTAEFLGTDGRFPPETEVTLFRVAQGLIGNILKHSGAENAVIKLECDNAKCVLKIEDDGKGFNVSKLTRVDHSGRGAGLFTMKERVRLAGGNCKIESRPGQGTKVTVNIPLPASEVDEKDKSLDS